MKSRMIFFFFFSSRRRHTRCYRDWSSDVCSSDLQAIAWMKTHGVTDLVLEDISYYRATEVFPDLAAGRLSPPFAPLGPQDGYQVAGGKTVHAYRFGAALEMQSIWPGLDAVIGPADGEGKTAPLAKGLVLKIAGQSAAGEGMGFGVPIVHYPDG